MAQMFKGQAKNDDRNNGNAQKQIPSPTNLLMKSMLSKRASLKQQQYDDFGQPVMPSQIMPIISYDTQTPSRRNKKGFRSFAEAQELSQDWHDFSQQLIKEKDHFLQTKKSLEFNRTQSQSLLQRAVQARNQSYSLLQRAINEDSKRNHQQHVRIRLAKHLFQNSSQEHTSSAFYTRTSIREDTEESTTKQANQSTLKIVQQQANVLQTLNPEQNQIPIPQLRFFCYTLNIDKWKPEVRESAQMGLWKDRIMLYGGIGKEVYEHVDELSLRTFTWKRYDHMRCTSDLHEQGRFGHSFDFYRGKFYSFGGERALMDSQTKMRDMSNDLRSLDPKRLQWSYLRLHGDIIESRSNHCTFFVGKFMFVSGGRNAVDKLLDDLTVINLETLKCTRLETEDSPYARSHGVCHHRAVSVFRGEVNLDRPEMSYTVRRSVNEKFLRNIQEEGVYVFGGRSGEAAINTLAILKFGCRPLRWVIPVCIGRPPTARMQHTLDYFAPRDLLIVAGGKSDKRSEKRHRPFVTHFEQVYVLRLSDMQWLAVQLNGVPSRTDMPFYAHASALADSKLIIFGGYCGNAFARGELRFIELDEEKARKLSVEQREKYSFREAIVEQETLVQDQQAIDSIVKQQILMQRTMQGGDGQGHRMYYIQQPTESLSLELFHFGRALELAERESEDVHSKVNWEQYETKAANDAQNNLNAEEEDNKHQYRSIRSFQPLRPLEINRKSLVDQLTPDNINNTKKNFLRNVLLKIAHKNIDAALKDKK